MNLEMELDLEIAERHGWHPFAVWLMQVKATTGAYDEPKVDQVAPAAAPVSGEEPR